MELDKLTLMNNEPITFQNQLIIYKPTLKTISTIGYNFFMRYVKILTITDLELAEENESNKTINGITDPFDFLIGISRNPQIFLELQIIFITFFKSGFAFDEKGIKIKIPPSPLERKKEDKYFYLNKNNYSEFQSVIRQMLMINSEDEDEDYQFNTDNEKMKQMFLAMRLRKKKAKEKQRLREAKQNSDKGLSLDEMVSALCVYNAGYNILNVWDLTLYQLKEQFIRCQKRDRFNADYEALLHGADSKKIRLKNWIK